MKQFEADVAVVAAGTAGLAAAVTAAENGASVVVLEKAATVGGAGNMARGPFAIDSKLQRHRKIAITKKDAFRTFMEHTHWDVDARLVSEYIHKSASTIDWLEGLGVNFIDVQCHNYSYYFTWHIIEGPLDRKEIPGTGIVMMKILFDRAKALGVNIHLRTPAERIIKEDGKIAGVMAEDVSGEEVQVTSKAVIVATGGCGDNPKMIKKYTGYDNARGMVPGNTGDGIRMVWEAGGARSKIIFHGGPGTPGLMEYLNISSAFGQPNLMVNLFGERFMDEEISQTTPFGGISISRQKDKTAFTIFDGETKDYYKNVGLDFPPGILYAEPMFTIDGFDEEFQQVMKDNPDVLFEADSIVELAGKIGVDSEKLKKTVEEYNKACDTGRDEVFYKDPRSLRPVRTPKFYCCKTSGMFGFGTLGGIEINHRTEVINKDFEVIPGLYAAGSDANNLYRDVYLFRLPGNTLGFALNSGRMAGENATEFVKSLGD